MSFDAFPKMHRLMRDVVVTEKIDGTNASIEFIASSPHLDPSQVRDFITERETFCTILDGDGTNGVGPDTKIGVRAGSKNRWLSPDVPDNYAFRHWVTANASALFQVLGHGRHFGEWWGAGVQRRYGLDHKRFSLFNVEKWTGAPLGLVPGLHLVPVLFHGPFDTKFIVQRVAEELKQNGSVAAPGFMQPEGIVVYHTHARQMFKYTFDKNDEHNGVTYTDVAPECTK